MIRGRTDALSGARFNKDKGMLIVMRATRRFGKLTITKPLIITGLILKRKHTE